MRRSERISLSAAARSDAAGAENQLLSEFLSAEENPSAGPSGTSPTSARSTSGKGFKVPRGLESDEEVDTYDPAKDQNNDDEEDEDEDEDEGMEDEIPAVLPAVRCLSDVVPGSSC